MKGNNLLVDKLNDLLSDELTAINQYMVHSEMSANWGYERLHKSIEKRAFQEMKHAEKLIAHIIFLDSKPTVSNLKGIFIGEGIEPQLKNDLHSEHTTSKSYNDAIKLAVEVGDNDTRELLEMILKDETAHIDWIEAQLDQIDQMGIGNYLAEQIKSE